MATPHEPTSPECPRCGYDLRGETDRWTDTCPLESTCPECGLDIRWTYVFGPMQAVPRWSVEHPTRRFLRAAVGTFFRSLLPRRFWQSLVMSSHAGLGSLFAYALIGTIAVSLLAAVPELAIDAKFGFLQNYITPTQHPWSTPTRLDAAYHGLSIILAPFGTFWWSRSNWPIPDIEWELLLPPLFVALCPAAYLCLPSTLNACKVRKTHLVRAFLLSIPAAIFSFELLYLGHILLMTGFSNATGRLLSFLYFIEPIAAAGVLWILPLFALQWTWWHAVNKRYLRLPNPRAITLAMLAIAALATLIPLFAFTPAGVQLVKVLGLA